MANLAQYVDFNVILDKSVTTPVITLTDLNNYPLPIGLYVTGVFTITQPDGITITGSFTSPDTYYNHWAVNKELRLNSTGGFQNGTYIFKYVVKCIGYDDTTLIKTVNFQYQNKSVTITNLVDVFTPSIMALDGTNYTQIGYTVTTTSRSWSAYIKYAGTSIVHLTSTAILFDLVYNTKYYDAHYDIDFESILYYQGNEDIDLDWLYVREKFTATDQIDAYTPMTLSDLVTGLISLKTAIDDGTYCGGCGCCCPPDYTPYNTAVSLYEQIIARGLDGDTVGLDEYVLQIKKIINCNGIISQTHTNTFIPAYNFGNTGGGGSVHAPIQFTVGSGGTYVPAAGTTDYDNPTIAGNNKYQIYDSGIANFLEEGVDFNYKTTGGFTLIASVFVGGTRYTLAFYP